MSMLTLQLGRGPAQVALTVEGGMLRPARSSDDPGQIVADPLGRVGGPEPIVIGDTQVSARSLAVAVIDHAVLQAGSDRGRPSGLTLAVPAGWTPRQRQALAQAAADAGWPDAEVHAAPVVVARRCLTPRARDLVGVIDVGAGVETSVVRLSPRDGDVVGIAATDEGHGLEHLDDALAERVLERAPAAIRDGLPSDDPAWRAAGAALRRAIAADASARRSVDTPGGRLAITITSDDLAHAVQREAEEIAEQFRRTLATAEVEQGRLRGIVVTGRGCRLPGLADELSQALAPVIVDDPALNRQVADTAVMGSATATPSTVRATTVEAPVATTVRRPPTTRHEAWPTPALPPARAAAPPDERPRWPTGAIAVIVISLVVIVASLVVIVLATQ